MLILYSCNFLHNAWTMRVREGRRWRGVPGKLQEINLEATLQHSLSVLITKVIIISIIMMHTAHCRRRQAKVANCSRVGGDPSPSSSEFEQGIADMQSQYVHLSWLVSMLWRHTRPSTHSPPFLLLPVQKCKTPSSFQTDCDPDGGGLLWGGAGGHLVGDFTDSVTHR